MIQFEHKLPWDANLAEGAPRLAFFSDINALAFFSDVNALAFFSDVNALAFFSDVKKLAYIFGVFCRPIARYELKKPTKA